MKKYFSDIFVFVLTCAICFFPGAAFTKGYVDLRSQMSPPKHQGSRNTCSVFSATSLMEFLIKREVDREVDLSEAYNYWAGKKYALDSNFLKEIYRPIDGLAGFLAVEAYRKGSMLESEWVYENKNWDQKKDRRCKRVAGKKSFECFTGTPPPNARRLRYGISPIYIARNKIGQFILKHEKPVVMNIIWCRGAVNNTTGNVRMPTPEEVTQSIRENSGHVITLVGYNPKLKIFIFRNSYGATWGTHGYGTIPEKYIVQFCEVCPQLKNLNTLPPDRKKFYQRASMGVSGSLVKLKTGDKLPTQSVGPNRVKISFAKAKLVYLPSQSHLQVIAAKAVVSYGEGWQIRKLKPYLFMLQPKSWDYFFWKINTATKLLYKSQAGASDNVKGKVTKVVEKDGGIVHIEVLLDNLNLVFLPKDKSLQLIAGGNVLSRGEDWKVTQIGSNQYHLAKKNWRAFFWLVDTARQRLYKVEEGKFGNPGGRQENLEATVIVK